MLYISNCFRAEVKNRFHVVKSQQSHGSETLNFWIMFLRFLKWHFKNVKSHVFGFKKRLETYSRTKPACSEASGSGSPVCRRRLSPYRTSPRTEPGRRCSGRTGSCRRTAVKNCPKYRSSLKSSQGHGRSWGHCGSPASYNRSSAGSTCRICLQTVKKLSNPINGIPYNISKSIIF